jgi:ubiquinone/menaquinone biosynthesis C-methylase UbiE
MNNSLYLNKFLHRVVANPWVYDKIQNLLGLKYSQQRLMPHLAQLHQKMVLDVGAGTGLYQSILPETAQYIWLDNDQAKLRGFVDKQTLPKTMMLGDATQLCLTNDSIDLVLCVAVSHHLTDEQLERLFREIARVTREKMVFLDAVIYPSPISRLLWQYDRGSLPRSTAALLAAIEVEFELEQVEEYKIYHHYLLCTARPKRFQSKNKG